MEFPTDEEVLAHGFRFRPTWWTPRAPAGWGDFLSQLSARERGYHAITRADLLAAPSCHGFPQALLAGYVWGTGDSAFLVGRRARVFRDNDPQRVVDALAAAAESLRAGDTVGAYASMLRGRPNYLKHLGPSFFTKFLYAADAGGDGRLGRALILDQFVAVTLRTVDKWNIPRYGPWEPSTYERWLDHAHALATGDVRADAVEMAYFKLGKEIAAGGAY
ncbi:8-oxoguanine DNA glycosylase OGG fold protein [Mycobacteroides abscessus]|uniref:8-oxoguanine DNA glycosylase OGG fold protein n=1 Tax=Mycobacteroides abscessus TaxID=36809 RepID=UPI00070E351C|nr:hypothetical protein [Mycobacteroides abscessus]ALM19125.1 hypothetical protein AOY11_25475 [Mycobacteroides abscessus]AMU49411.1 hypothetical protein A3O01_04060 [Mycobacteroides abscessus]ANO08083.1 hypothetical protein BAB76_04060 [Mycobacteroides abscessus]MDM3921147.1 hypothetical protein [Mycobacteroides abscessus]MDO2965012.1 hypothetical protein [Mycobacteroides abscessus subsp. abscessus]